MKVEVAKAIQSVYVDLYARLKGKEIINTGSTHILSLIYRLTRWRKKMAWVCGLLGLKRKEDIRTDKCQKSDQMMKSTLKS